jgi:hypothetical protein
VIAARLPNFLIIGAMRASTTIVYQDLRRTQVFMPEESDLLCTPLPPGLAEVRFARLFSPASEDQFAVRA